MVDECFMCETEVKLPDECYLETGVCAYCYIGEMAPGELDKACQIAGEAHRSVLGYLLEFGPTEVE